MFIEAQLLKWRDCLVDTLFEILTNSQGTTLSTYTLQIIVLRRQTANRHDLATNTKLILIPQLSLCNFILL